MKTDKEIAEKARERAKKQNEAAKNNWDCISCRLPKGTKKRIQALGYTVNGFLNFAVLAGLEKLETETPQIAQPETVKEEQPEQPEQAERPKADPPEDVAALNIWLHQVQEENEQKRLQEVARRQLNAEAENGYD